MISMRPCSPHKGIRASHYQENSSPRQECLRYSVRMRNAFLSLSIPASEPECARSHVIEIPTLTPFSRTDKKRHQLMAVRILPQDSFEPTGLKSQVNEREDIPKN